MDNLKTTLRYYSIDLKAPGGFDAYQALSAKLTAMGLRMMDTLSETSDPVARTYRDAIQALDGQEIELETNFLFDDQWNTTPIGDSKNGLRVFDWHEDIWPNRSLKTGQWLEQTDAMVAARAQHLKCGYCGHMVHASEAPADLFCDQCLGSEYLKRSDLNLLRMFRVDTPFGLRRAELDEAEAASLVPRWLEAQIYGRTERDKARLAKARERNELRYQKALADAHAEYEGAKWLMDNLPGALGDAIFYNHTGRFGFGWRQPLDADMVSQLLEKISEFPFPYDIKCADGKTLSGER